MKNTIEYDDMESMEFTDVLNEINEDIKRIPRRNILVDILNRFVEQHNIYMGNGSVNKKGIATKLLEINNGVPFLSYKDTSFVRNVNYWYNGATSFMNSGVLQNERKTPRQKLIAFMLYTQLFNDEEADSILDEYGHDKLYIFDTYESCAKICFRCKFTYNVFLQKLVDIKNWLANGEDDYSKAFNETFRFNEEYDRIVRFNAEQKDDMESFEYFVSKYNKRFGKVHIGAYYWLRNNLLDKVEDEMSSEMPEEYPIKHIERLINERKTLASRKDQNELMVRIGKEFVLKNAFDDASALTRDDYLYAIELILNSRRAKNLTSIYIDKILHHIKNSQYEQVEKMIGWLIYVCRYSLSFLEYEKTRNTILGSAWFDFDLDSEEKMVDMEQSISREFFLLNILMNMSCQYIQKNYISNLDVVSDSAIAEEIILQLNMLLLQVGFARLNASNGGLDYLTLTAITYADYGVETEGISSFPFRKFLIGKSEDFDYCRNYMAIEQDSNIDHIDINTLLDGDANENNMLIQNPKDEKNVIEMTL